jgi:hypothetical protein
MACEPMTCDIVSSVPTIVNNHRRLEVSLAGLLILGLLGSAFEPAVLLAAAAAICLSHIALDVAFDVHEERELRVREIMECDAGN